jgi:hypothetical protein
MDPIKLPQTVSHSLSIRRAEIGLQAPLVMALAEDTGWLNEVAAQFLGPIEAAYFSTLRSERRRKSYLLGRYAAKLALREPLAEPDRALRANGRMGC